MACIFTNVWKVLELAFFLKPLENVQPVLEMGLYTNTPTITPASVIGDFTEPTPTGYARIPFEAMTFNGGSTSDTVTFVATDPTFTFDPYSGGETANGYFVFDSANAVLVGADSFPIPFVIPAGGGTQTLVVTGGLNQLPLP